MNTLVGIPRIFAVLSLLIGGCSSLAPRPDQQTRAGLKSAPYELVLGKPVGDRSVADFIEGNRCSAIDQFQLCQESGVALWLDSNQVTQTIYLYLNQAGSFAAYKGDLPFGLKFYDTMGAVEYKLQRQGIGRDGFPDLGQAPDHHHYQANYHEVGMTILYNTPFADEDATIYAILLHAPLHSR